MSGFISEPVRTDEHQVGPSNYGDSDYFSQQKHDRSSKGPGTSHVVSMNEQDEAEVEMDISAGQKMLSAVSGALLTSLLGKSLYP